MPTEPHFSLDDADLDQVLGESLRWLERDSAVPATVIRALGSGRRVCFRRSKGGEGLRSRRRRSPSPRRLRPIVLVAFADARSAPVLRALFGMGRGQPRFAPGEVAGAITRPVAAATTDLELDDTEEGALFVWIAAVGPEGGRHSLSCEFAVSRADTADPRLAPAWRLTRVQAISRRS